MALMTIQDDELQQRRLHAPENKAVSSESPQPTLKQNGNGPISTPSPATTPNYTLSPVSPTATHRFAAPLPLMHAGKPSAQGATFAVAPARSNSAHPQMPVEPISNMRHTSNVASVMTSACRSHASALVHTASQEWKPPQMTTAPADNNKSTSLRHHEAVFEREMKIKCMAFPLSSPSTVRIGDVGVFTAGGYFEQHFNICEPGDLPPYFSPLNAPIRSEDFCTYLDFEPHTYLASASIDQCEDLTSGTVGARFVTSASEGAIIALPSGARRTELREIAKFREFISTNADNWAHYLSQFDGKITSLHLITGQLCAPFWGIASFAGNTDRELTLAFNQPSCEKDAKYQWSATPLVKTSLSGKLRFSRPADTLAVTSFTITPRAATIPVSKATEEGEPIKIDEVAAVNRHPCDGINERLLAMTKAKVALSHERDWCAVLSESDKVCPDEAEMVDRVFEANELCHDEDMTFLRWKSKRVETATPADLLKDIDGLRDTLDEVGESDLLKRADILHAITQNILTYLRVSKNKDPRDSNFLLSIAVSNVIEEVKITSTLGQDRAPSLHLYASTMWARFQTGGDAKFLEQAISYYHRAIAIDGRHTDSMADLAMALWTRFARGSHRMQDLDEVILLYRTLLFTQIANNPRAVEWLNGLGLALWERYKLTKSMNDMDQAISYFRRASISYPIPCDPFTLSNLGNILMAKARAFKDHSESDEAITCYRKALDSVTPLHPNRSAFLSNLGDALSYRYERRCLIGDLNEAIRCYERALELPSPHHRDRISSLVLYAEKLQTRFNRSGDREDLELAVKQFQEAKRLATPGHPKYAQVVEGLVLAQREMDGHYRRRSSEFPSPPPSSLASPTFDSSQVPTLRPSQWPSSASSSTRPLVGSATSPYRTVPKYRIVSRSHTAKPYSRPRHGSSASDSESSSSHHTYPPAARSNSPQYHHRSSNPRRHHTMPTGMPL